MKRTIKTLIGSILLPIYLIGILCAFVFHTFMNGLEVHKAVCDYLDERGKEE